MTAITVTYQMPDDMHDFNMAHHASLAWATLGEIDGHTRNQIKHGDPANATATLERIRTLALEALRSIE